MKLLIVYDSAAGGTRRVAEKLATAAIADGAEAALAPTSIATRDDVATADVLLLGCGVSVRRPFGGERPHRMAAWIGGLPPLEGRRAGAFCTYSFFPVFFSDAVARTAAALNELSAGLEEKGATVVATQAVHRRKPADSIRQLVHSLLHPLDA